jgi:hypothetical protein
MGFCCLSRVMGSVKEMPVCSVGMMGRHLVIPCLVVFRGLAMMTGRMLMVFGCFAV